MRVGVIGCGAVARKAHLPAYRSLHADIVGVSDPVEGRAKSAAKRFGARRWFANYHDLLKEDLDLVSICTPNTTHAQITIDAAGAGKNILVEKPMATNLQDADNMITACENAGVKLCVMHNYRLFECVQDARKRVESGRIGNIVSMHAIGWVPCPMQWSPSEWFYYKWGLLDDFGYHLVDIMNVLCNSTVEEVKVIATDYVKNMQSFNCIQAIILFKNQACAHLDLSWITGAYELSLKILGTSGMLYVDIRNNHVRETHGYWTPVEELTDSVRKSLRVAKASLDRTYFKGGILYTQEIIRRSIESIDKDTRPPVSGREGRAVIAILDSLRSQAEKSTTRPNEFSLR